LEKNLINADGGEISIKPPQSGWPGTKSGEIRSDIGADATKRFIMQHGPGRWPGGDLWIITQQVIFK
jgi:hypothetical protein